MVEVKEKRSMLETILSRIYSNACYASPPHPPTLKKKRKEEKVSSLSSNASLHDN